MKIFKHLSVALAGIVLFAAFAGCAPSSDGKDPDLKLYEGASELSIENENIRIVFNKKSGSVREIYNKESALYLIRDCTDATPITIQVRGTLQNKYLLPRNNSFSYEVLTDNASEKSLMFAWAFENGVKATATATLKGYEDEIVFTSALSGLDGETFSVQYPILENVSELYEDGENDFLVSPMATGYLFRNPVNNFFRYGQDLSGQSAAYPSGFGSTMQFLGYYAQNRGGFYFQTKDGGNTIKDFTVKNNGGKLRIEIGHYVSDLSYSSERFSYETIISNLNEGNWYEPAEKYKLWAEEQSWVKAHGKNEDRTDINKTLYENTALVNFIAPSKNTQSYALSLYEKIRENINTPSSKILTVPYYYSIPQEVSPTDNIEAYFSTHKNEALYQALERNGEPVAFFEYTDLQQENKISGLPEWIADSRLKNAQGNISDIMFAENWQYICAGNSMWRSLVTNRQQEQFSKLGAEGIYNDLGICAVHPLNCFDASHEHGSRVNILEDYYELMGTSWEITRRNQVDVEGNCGFTGQEMITEQVIPYVDFYQTRSAGGEMSGMEHDQIMKLVQHDVAIKIPLFEYVYHEYAGVRGDGFTLPISSIGVPYYHTVAYTALNGGIPEFNYECISSEAFSTLADDFDTQMIGFIDVLGKARLTYGKEYLVYGCMTRVPDLGLKREEFSYETPIVINWGNNGGLKKGSMLLDPVVASAYCHNGKVAIFLCNITENDQSVSFTLDAKVLYGKTEGSVSLLRDGEEEISLGALDVNGSIDLSLNLKSRSVYMISLI